jgi:dephospho-CoA kinase
VNRTRKVVVGLTGRYCSGKGTAADVFAALGFSVIDADEVSHQVMADKSEEVIAAFGSSIRAKNSGVDRRTLGRIVFADPAARTRLEGILYPAITQRITRFIEDAEGNVVINAPLLQRAGLQRVCTVVVFLRAPAIVRLIRAMRRDSLPLREAWTRVNAQKDVRPQPIGPGVDIYSVLNCASARSLRRRIARLARRLKV